MVEKYIKPTVIRIAADIKAAWKALVVLAVILTVMQLLFHEICPMKILLGIPCPGCGLTHGCIYILSLHWREAWEANCTAFLWLPALVILCIDRYVLGRSSRTVWGALIVISALTLVRYAIYFPFYLEQLFTIC